MPYMVTFRDEEGRNGFHLYDDREEALRMVEHFRNADEVTDLRLYDATTLPLEFRAYYRAEISNSTVDAVGTNRPAEPLVPEVVEPEAPGGMADEAPGDAPAPPRGRPGDAPASPRGHPGSAPRVQKQNSGRNPRQTRPLESSLVHESGGHLRSGSEEIAE